MLDWELSTLGNPWSDVAYLTAMMYHLPKELGEMTLSQPLVGGIPAEERLLARWVRDGGGA